MNILFTQKIKLFLFGVICISILGACTEDDSVAPEITISSPVEAEEFTITDEILLVGRATDNEGLSNLQIVSDLGLNETITQFDDPQDFLFNINITLDENTAAGDYTLEIIATDDAANSQSKSIGVKIVE